jgi:hypothetical protein
VVSNPILTSDHGACAEEYRFFLVVGRDNGLLYSPRHCPPIRNYDDNDDGCDEGNRRSDSDDDDD